MTGEAMFSDTKRILVMNNELSIVITTINHNNHDNNDNNDNNMIVKMIL